MRLALFAVLSLASAQDPGLVLREGALHFPDATIAPGREAAFTVTLKAAGPALRLRAYSAWEAESGSAYSLQIEINGAAVTDAHHPDGPKTHQLVNHPKYNAKSPWFDPTAKAWALFIDSDPVPADRASPYFCPEAPHYLYVFPIGTLLKAGENRVVLRNLGRYPIRVLSEETHAAESAEAGPSPDDRLLPAKREFPAPKAADLRDRFLSMHRWMEKLYNGDGTWGRGYSDWPGQPAVKRPLTRFTGYCVLAYLVAEGVESDELYTKRRNEGLGHLLKEQDDSGAFRWYWTEEGRLGEDALYETGIAGRALIAGYEATKEKKYLEASSKAAAWELATPVSANANYNFFAVWHLAAHYRVTKEAKVLDGALSRALASLKGQTARGCWSDRHNQTMWYHGIILRGLVELAAAMPAAHADRATIMKAAVRAANHAIREQRDDGSLHLHPSKREPYCGSLVAPALMQGERLLGWKLDDALAGLNSCPLGVDLADPVTPKSTIDDAILWAAEAWRRAAGR
jgi:hypothetical protein